MEEKMKKVVLSIMALAIVAAEVHPAAAQQQRDVISIVGSSTVYPFSAVVAERMGRAGGFKTPKVESTGTGGGFKLFCQGVGVQHPDIANASRAIKSSELDACRSNGVQEVVEVKIGYDGIVLANSRKGTPLQLTRRDIFLALAKEIPDPKGEEGFVMNPYRTWKEVNPSLPGIRIEVLGPPPTSGTRDAFLELAMEPGAQEIGILKKLAKDDAKKFRAIAHTLREDGAYVDAGENDNLIVQKLTANVDAVGIFGFSFLDQNTDKVQGAYIEAAEPTFDNIADGAYPLSRPLYIYVKKAHAGVIPGIREFVAEFTSERAWGTEGYLSEKGLIPLPDAERKEAARNAREMKPMK
jgi:phosphate transport system substrate-binding protein